MADLLGHLISPSSQESQHFARQSLDGHSGDEAPTNKDDSTIADLQAAGLNVHDVASYLNDPENERLLAEASKKKKANPNPNNNNNSTSTSTQAPTVSPVQIGTPKTSHHVPHLNHLCQERGLQPTFSFEEPQPQRFSVVLRFGDHVVTKEGQLYASKREAKEGVAVEGVRVVEGIPIPGPSGVKGGGAGEENWIGKLAGLGPSTIHSSHRCQAVT